MSIEGREATAALRNRAAFSAERDFVGVQVRSERPRSPRRAIRDFGKNCCVGRDERVAAEKTRLRAELLASRAARSTPDLEWARAAIRGHVLDRAVGVERVAGYLPLRTEPGSVELLAELGRRGVEALVPVLLPDRDLDWAPWTAEGLGAGLGVDAIRTAGLVLVPALAVAVDGTRLGRGGGSYDRALARCAGTSVIAALLFDGEVVPGLPRDPWDVPVSAAVTPSGWIALGGNAEVRFRG